MIGHANSACFARVSVEREVLRSFLLTHSPPANNLTKQIQTKKMMYLLAEEVRAPFMYNRAAYDIGTCIILGAD